MHEQRPVPERTINVNPRYSFFARDLIFLPIDCLEYHFVFS